MLFPKQEMECNSLALQGGSWCCFQLWLCSAFFHSSPLTLTPSYKYCPDLPEVILRAASMSAAERKRWQIAIQVLAGGMTIYIGRAVLYISFLSFLFFVWSVRFFLSRLGIDLTPSSKSCLTQKLNVKTATERRGRPAGGQLGGGEADAGGDLPQVVVPGGGDHDDDHRHDQDPHDDQQDIHD